MFPGALGNCLCVLWCSWLLQEGDESRCGCVSWRHLSEALRAAIPSARCLWRTPVPSNLCNCQADSSRVIRVGHKYLHLLPPFWTCLCVSCALTRGHCTTCCSLINNLLTCLAALCSVACFTTLPGVLECWFPWQPDIAFLFFITITVLLLPCSNVLSSLFCLGVCARASHKSVSKNYIIKPFSEFGKRVMICHCWFNIKWRSTP